MTRFFTGFLLVIYYFLATLMCKSPGCGYMTDHSGNLCGHEATHAVKRRVPSVQNCCRNGVSAPIDNKECKLGARLLQLQAALS